MVVIECAIGEPIAIGEDIFITPINAAFGKTKLAINTSKNISVACSKKIKRAHHPWRRSNDKQRHSTLKLNNIEPISD